MKGYVMPKYKVVNFSKEGQSIRVIARYSDQECAASEDPETQHYNKEELRVTPLHQAAFHGNAEKVKELLCERANPNITDAYGWTPLHDAAMQGHAEIVKLLLEAGANINAQDEEDHYTPLHDAVRMNHKEVVKLLLAAGANTSLQDRWGNTPRDIAQTQNYLDIVALLDRC